MDGKIVQRELRKFGKEGEDALQRIQKASKPAARGLKALDATVGEMKSSAARLSARVGPLGSALSALGPVGLAASVGIGALVLGLTVAADRSREAVAAITEVANAARRAGLDAQDFQELAYVAEVNQISIDALTDGIKELNLRADEFIVTGKGSAAEAFQRLGFSADELSERLRNPADLMVEIIKRTEDLDRAAQIRIADELFGGTGGERFVELINRGSASVEALVGEFRELGIGFDQNMISKAEDADREFRKLSLQIDNNFKEALVNLAPVALATTRALLKISEALGVLSDAFSDFEEKSSKGRTSALDRLREDLARQEEKIAIARERRNTPGVASFVIDDEIRQLEAERAQIRRQLTARERAEFSIRDRESVRRLGASSTSNEPTEADRAAAEAWRKRILTADQERKNSLAEIARFEKDGLLSAEDAALARLDAEKTYAAAIKKTGRAGRQEEAKLLREVQSLLKASQAPATELKTRLERIAELQSEGLFDRATGGKGEAAAQRARVVAMREYLGAAEDTAEALEHLRDLARDGIGADALAAQVALAEEAGKSFGETMSGVGDKISDSLTDAIFEAGEEAESFSEIMERLARQLARDFVNSQFRNLFGQISGGFGGGGGNLITSLFSSLLGGGRSASPAIMQATAGIYHDGGRIGPGGRTRQVPMSLFAGAERRHGGGFIGPRERAIIAEDDERMLTLAMQKNTADSLRSLASLASRPAPAMPAGSGAPIVNIYAPAGQEVSTRERQGAGGARELDVIIGQVDRSIATKIAEGTSHTGRAIGKRYGLNRANGLAG
nr:phage tail tape measure protein [Roseibium sp. CAU 1639]